jgi:mono/diheme cytochrome c family protein
LAGIPASNGVAGPIMPGFSGAMNDAQVTELVNYLRTSVARKAPWRDADKVVRAARAMQRSAEAERLISGR